ncbi:MAG: hypothetical protein QGF74_03520 [Candidatus Nanoarchaeia archaeon]|jgi:hypothetical protein|nr:hypothetical protein [Candidatus Nanoarchaeia archaeon]|tara:strand:+ start:40265 stop:40651 length:387 start_codon:yes stop_codon:yes gene_type:complete
MRNREIDIKRIEVHKLFLNENKVSYKIYFRLDDNMKNIYLDFPLTDSYQIVKTLLNYVKEVGDVLVEDSYDVLQSIVLIKINDQEDVETKLIDFFSKLIGKVKSLKDQKTSDNYLDRYNKLMSERLEL